MSKIIDLLEEFRTYLQNQRRDDDEDEVLALMDDIWYENPYVVKHVQPSSELVISIENQQITHTCIFCGEVHANCCGPLCPKYEVI